MRIAALFIFALLATQTMSSQERDRAKVPDKYKWNLKDIYPTDDAWQEAKKQFAAEMPKVGQFKGTLGQSAKQLLACLQFDSDLSKTFARLSVYASLTHDQDTRDSKYLAMTQEIGQLGSDYGAKSSFIRPEILKMDSAAVMSLVDQEKGLEIYRHALNDILRTKAHTGTEGEEKIIADASLISGAPSSVFGIFSDADFPYADVTLSDGSTVKLDKATFNRLRPAPNREDRKKVFSTFFSKLYDFRRTFGTMMDANVKSHMFYSKASNYGSSIERALDANNIPVQVYHSLVDGVNANLPTFHRYLNLRKRILGLDTLHYYDLYAPLVSGLDLKYSIEESEKHVLAAVKPLGKEYANAMARAFNERWVDFFPTEGKRAGAYMQAGAYDVHPYLLLNYNDKYDDMSTLAHELGHTMQSYLSNKAQPYPLADYPIFVAEVASTFNEALLIDYMLKQIKDDKQKLSLLGNYLENIKGTVFRQSQFAEFELRVHEVAEKGEALTGDRLNELYMEITKKYYGHDKGVCIVDDEIKSEWSFVPHFYYNFYVYQYATSFTASAALSEKVLAGDKEATAKYLTFLSAGGSKYPIDLLKDAGVDMTTSQPLELTMKKMNRVIDEMETILDKMKK